ncbi:hypothetical protein CEXT_812941 [Caerostris extrusa]|uniref:Uncharacterized protein n=1 Tax=Caerostris extrusa TaxID=172846 RepID=A0AAV4P858_CAEEX|nr:hypothetical protein CEXT_812941 [Caerostris extrusa]
MKAEARSSNQFDCCGKTHPFCPQTNTNGIVSSPLSFALNPLTTLHLNSLSHERWRLLRAFSLTLWCWIQSGLEIQWQVRVGARTRFSPVCAAEGCPEACSSADHSNVGEQRRARR